MTVGAVRDGAGSRLGFRQSVVAFEDDPRKQTNHLLVALDPPLEPGKTAVVEIEYGGYLAGYVETGSLYIQDRVDEAFTILTHASQQTNTKLRDVADELVRTGAVPSPG